MQRLSIKYYSSIIILCIKTESSAHKEMILVYHTLGEVFIFLHAETNYRHDEKNIQYKIYEMICHNNERSYDFVMRKMTMAMTIHGMPRHMASRMSPITSSLLESSSSVCCAADWTKKWHSILQKHALLDQFFIVYMHTFTVYSTYCGLTSIEKLLLSVKFMVCLNSYCIEFFFYTYCIELEHSEVQYMMSSGIPRGI